MLNALTIDVEEHFHVCGLPHPLSTERLQQSTSLVVPQTQRLLALLARARVKATFFVLGTVAERHPTLVRRIAEEGHEIGSHGYRHELIYRQTRQAFEQDVAQSLRLLAACVPRPILGYRAPSFSVTNASAWAVDTLVRLGFRYDCSVFPILNPRYGIPGAPRVPYQWKGLIEFPLSTFRLGPMNIPVAGGAYFRILPWTLLRQAYRALNRQGIPVQVYLHPWELDPTIPRLPIPWHRALTHYWNVEHAEQRLVALLKEFAFAPVQQVLGI